MFELITGQPPFDTIMTTRDLLISQMIESIGELPERWMSKCDCSQTSPEDEKYSLEEWLGEVYFGEGKTAELSHEQLMSWAKIIRMLMRSEPSDRVSAAEILQDKFFNE